MRHQPEDGTGGGRDASYGVRSIRVRRPTCTFGSRGQAEGRAGSRCLARHQSACWTAECTSVDDEMGEARTYPQTCVDVDGPSLGPDPWAMGTCGVDRDMYAAW